MMRITRSCIDIEVLKLSLDTLIIFYKNKVYKNAYT